VIYIAYFLLSGWSQADRYLAEVSRAEERYAAVRGERAGENPFRGDVAAIAEGQETFSMVCAACHQADGTGLVGPSLVGSAWKYGGSDADLFESVAEGRPQGMPPWAAQLGTDRIWKVLAFMETLPRQQGPEDAASGAGPGGR
jgi:cytochrome c oxidase cbb3-type subunit III